MMNLDALDALKKASQGLNIAVKEASIGFDVNGAPLMTFTASYKGYESDGVVHLPATEKDLRMILASKVVRSACRQ